MVEGSEMSSDKERERRLPPFRSSKRQTYRVLLVGSRSV